MYPYCFLCMTANNLQVSPDLSLMIFIFNCFEKSFHIFVGHHHVVQHDLEEQVVVHFYCLTKQLSSLTWMSLCLQSCVPSPERQHQSKQQAWFPVSIRASSKLGFQFEKNTVKSFCQFLYTVTFSCKRF